MIPLMAAAAGASLLNGLFNKQKAPAKADYTPVDLTAEQKKSIDANLGAEASIEQLLSQANKYTQGQSNSLMEMAVPGFSKLAQKFTTMAGDSLDNRYNMPKEVTDNLSRIAAERGISTGVRGQAGDFSLLRDLGVNMLDYGRSQTQQAQSLLSTIVGLSPRVNPMSPLSFYVTPKQQAGVTGDNNVRSQRISQDANNADASAANWNQSNLWNSLTLASVLGAKAFGGK